ncbi:unnamed protein product, partial [Nesidiocoris tenuis]
MKPGDDAIVDVLSISEEALLVNFYDGNGRSLCGGSNVPKICPMPIIQRSGSFIICHKENEAIFLHKEDTTEIIDLLNRLYKQHEGSEVPQMRNLEIGDICAAKSEDDNWYRARIMAINGASYLIYFVDYGNFENVLADNTRLLDSTFFMPELCVKVALPLNYKDSADCFNELGEDPIKCTFIRYNTVNKLWTVDLFNSSGKSYAQLWIEGNKAEDDGSIAVDPKLRAAGWCLRKGDSVPIIITHVESANHFFAHLQDNLVNLDILESKIQNLPPEPVDSDEMFAAKYEDSVWYRAIAAGEKVFYLDHGNTDEALEKRKLPDEFKRPREGFAIELHLCVAPVDGLWTDEANCIFDDFINKEDLNMIVKSLDFKIIVDLKSGDQFLSSILVDGGHAVPADLKQNDKKFIAQDAGNRDEDRVTPAEIDQQPPVVETVPKSTQVAGGPVSEPIKLNVDKDLYKNCTLVHSNGPYDFFVHTDDDQIKIEEMANALFEAGSFPKLEAVKQSDFVVAQFTEDDAYYRAVVTNVEPEIVVHFVDYGNSSPATTFHHLPNDLKHIPQLALRCSLQSPVGGWSVDAIDRFENLTAEAKAFDVEILSRGDPNIVDVVIDGRSINHLLDATAKFETPSQHPKLTSAPAEMDEPSKTSAFESSVDDRTASQTVKESSPAEMKSQNNQKSLKDTGYCYICYIKAGACYIQDEDTNSEVEKIMELLQNIDMSDEKQELKDVKIGDWVVTLYEESLYRATVVRSDPLEVFFVDYGNCSPAKKCFKPPADLISIKPLAVKVNLDFGDGLTLNEDGLVELQNLAEHGANYVLKGDSTIELSIEGAKVADLLKDYLVSSDACSPSPSIKTDTIIQTDAASAIVAEAVAIAPATIRSATTVSEEQAATSSTVTSMPEAVAPTPAAGTAPGVKDAPPSGPPATRAAADTATTNAAIALSMKPNEAQSFEVLVSHVVSPSEFYYQMDTDKVDEVVSRLASAEKDFETFDNCQSIEEVLPSPDANSEAMEVTSKPAAIGGVQITPISCTTNSCVTVSEATHSNISNASPMTDEMWIKEPKISKTSSSKQAHNGGESPSILSSSPASLAEFSGSSKVKIIQITTPSTSGCPTVKANSPSMVEPESAIVGEPADLDLPESKLVDITSNDVCHIEAKSNSPIDVFHSADVAVPEPEFCSSQLSVKLDSMALHSSPAQIEEQPDECISETASKKWTNVHSPHTDQTQSEVPSIDSAKSAQDAGCLFKPLNLKEAVLSVIDLKEPDQDNANPRDLLPCKDMIVDSEIPNLTPDNILQLTDEHSKQEIVKPSSQIVALTENDGKLSPSRKTGTANPANAKKKIIAKPDVPSVKSIQTPAPVTGNILKFFKVNCLEIEIASGFQRKFNSLPTHFDSDSLPEKLVCPQSQNEFTKKKFIANNSEDEIQSFRCSKNVDPTTVDPIFADPYYCYGESYLAPVNPVLCYEIENSPYLGRYFLEEKTAGTKKHLESRLEALSVRGLNIFTDQLPLPVPADREPYRYGSPLRYAGGELLTIPTSLLGKGSCSAQVVRYLLDVDNVCNSYADPASCVTDGRFQLSSFLSGDSAEKLWLADIQSGNSRTSVDSAVAVYCGRADRPFSGYVECDDLPSIMKTRYDRAANACENVVTQLRFDLKWFENRLTLANVTVLLSTVSLSNQLTSVPSRKRSRPTIWQHFQVALIARLSTQQYLGKSSFSVCWDGCRGK